jgi:hypothetical protein
LSLAAPALAASGGLPAEVSNFGDEYPFSVAVEAALAVKDVLAMNRDHYEGDDCSTRAKKEKKKKKRRKRHATSCNDCAFWDRFCVPSKKNSHFSS